MERTSAFFLFPNWFNHGDKSHGNRFANKTDYRRGQMLSLSRLFRGQLLVFGCYACLHETLQRLIVALSWRAFYQ